MMKSPFGCWNKLIIHSQDMRKTGSRICTFVYANQNKGEWRILGPPDVSNLIFYIGWLILCLCNDGIFYFLICKHWATIKTNKQTHDFLN